MKFKIGFEKEDVQKLHEYWNEIIISERWSEGKFTRLFEDSWSENNKLLSVTFSSWGGAARAVLDYINVRDKVVLCPSNTFMATPLSAIRAGARIEFVDCNKDDLCLSIEDLKDKIDKYNPIAVWVVHIGGHIAFQIKEIAELCRNKGVYLLEDCAHAHGASWNGQKPGSWGLAGIYSFYATKTVSTGEGGMLVTPDDELYEYACKYRNYGKFDYEVQGTNYRMSEFTAALGYIQTQRLSDIVAWKNEYAQNHLDKVYINRVMFPEGMISGYYKYIVFDEIENSAGRVYDELCHHILKKNYALPNSEWVSKNHWCVPFYYKGNE